MDTSIIKTSPNCIIVVRKKIKKIFNCVRHFFTCQIVLHKPIIMIYNYSPGSEHMYGFSEFTCSLNEPEPGVCPTDSRLAETRSTYHGEC